MTVKADLFLVTFIGSVCLISLQPVDSHSYKPPFAAIFTFTYRLKRRRMIRKKELKTLASRNNGEAKNGSESENEEEEKGMNYCHDRTPACCSVLQSLLTASAYYVLIIRTGNRFFGRRGRNRK